MTDLASDRLLKAEALTLPALASIEVKYTRQGLAVSGTITTKEPDKQLGIFFRAVHEQMLTEKQPELSIDVRGLTFVNSSAIRLFIDWAIWVSQPPGPTYKLRFIRSREITWQRISFPPLAQLAAKHLVIEDGA
jgi:hypothetical protein